jgi:NAD(P)H-hydrate epimerase
VGVDYRVAHDKTAMDVLDPAVRQSDVVIDGLLGIGARGPMRPELAVAVQHLNKVRRDRPDLFVVAVDVPSGIDADTGAVPGAAVRADATVTFGAIKAGLLRFPAAEYAGELVVRSIELSSELVRTHSVFALDTKSVRAQLPARPLDAHKYRLGRVLVVAGSDQFLGAAALCSAAAARSGCGLVAVATSAAVKAALATRVPEAIYPVPALDVEGIPDESANRVLAVLPSHQALVIGPGLGRSDAMSRFFRTVMTANGQSTRPVPAVIDADALTLLSEWDAWWEAIGHNNILTPHAGEMGRLLNDDDVGSVPPWELAAEWGRRWGQTVVLKGPFTVVAQPDGPAWVYPHANPALATAGTGDVLAGLCGGLLAQGVAPGDAARLAVVIHALAARQIVHARGWRSLLASDLPDVIPATLHQIAKGDSG